MDKWKVAFLDAETFDRAGDVSCQAFTGTWSCTFHRITKPEETLEHLQGFDVAVTNKVVLDAKVLDAVGQSLKLVAIAATGTNNVDLEAARKLGIPVCNVAGYSSASVAQFTFALILELASHAGDHAIDNRTSAWSSSPIFTRLAYPGIELKDKVLGLVGFGGIGQAVARIAQGFGMKVIVSARPGASTVPDDRVAFDEMLRTADVVSLHCPLTPETQDLIGAREFGLMKKSAFLVNTARGGIVNEGALIAALESGRIAGAGFDVVTQEPPPKEHPMMEAATRLNNLYLTPHCAWACVEARQRLLDEVFENIRSFEKGIERNRVG